MRVLPSVSFVYVEKQVLCYFDLNDPRYPDTAAIRTAIDPINNFDTIKEICGGFFVDNYVDGAGDTEFFSNQFFELYFATQVSFMPEIPETLRGVRTVSCFSQTFCHHA